MLHDAWSGVCGDESINAEEWIKELKERGKKIRKLIQENEAEARRNSMIKM